MPATETPTTTPRASVTGPPELPGCMPPLTCTWLSKPEASRRSEDTDDSLTVMFLPSSSAEREAENVDLLRLK